MASADYIIAMTSIYDTEKGFTRLINALQNIDKKCIYIEKENITLNHIPKMKIKPCEVEDTKKEFVVIIFLITFLRCVSWETDAPFSFCL